MIEKLKELLKNNIYENLNLFYNILENQLTKENAIHLYFLCLNKDLEIKDFHKNFIIEHYSINEVNVQNVANLILIHCDILNNETAEEFFIYSVNRTKNLLKYAGYKSTKFK